MTRIKELYQESCRIRANNAQTVRLGIYGKEIELLVSNGTEDRKFLIPKEEHPDSDRAYQEALACLRGIV